MMQLCVFLTLLLLVSFPAFAQQPVAPKRIPEQVFDDVPPTHPYFAEITTLTMQGYTNGCDGANFCPDDPLTRNQAVVFLARLSGLSFIPPVEQQQFADIQEGVHGLFAEEAFRRRITSGCAVNLFCPDDPVTREQAAIFICRALGRIRPRQTAQAFADVGAERASYPYVNFAASRGITSGCGNGLFCPDQVITRGEWAAFLVRGFEL